MFLKRRALVRRPLNAVQVHAVLVHLPQRGQVAQLVDLALEQFDHPVIGNFAEAQIVDDCLVFAVEDHSVVKSPDQPFGLDSTYTKDAKFVANILSSMGYRKVYYLEGGITDWIKNGGRVIDPDNRPTLKK